MSKPKDLQWDGEKVLHKMPADEKKFTPKEILNFIDGIRGQLAQLNQQKAQAEQQLKTVDAGIAAAKKDEAELAPFEEKCVELQRNKVIATTTMVHEECLEKAMNAASAEIAKSPDAYTDSQKENLPYLKYQNALATHKKMNDKVCKRMITECLFTEPVFENPFKKGD